MSEATDKTFIVCELNLSFSQYLAPLSFATLPRVPLRNYAAAARCVVLTYKHRLSRVISGAQKTQLETTSPSYKDGDYCENLRLRLFEERSNAGQQRHTGKRKILRDGSGTAPKWAE
jgi:hypothetical protein